MSTPVVTPTPVANPVDTWFSNLLASFAKRYPTLPVLVHTTQSVNEGPMFPAGRVDFVSCTRWADLNNVPIQMYIGVQVTLSNPDTDSYACVVGMTLAFQSQQAKINQGESFAPLDWVTPASI